MVVILWELDLQLPMQSVPITTDVVSSNVYQGEVVVIIWWCDLHHHMCDLQLHMSYITEIQEAVVLVIIWWCDLQLHISYITEIQEGVVGVIIWWCDLQLHMSPLKPLGQLKPNCPGMIIGRSSTKFLFFMPIGNPRWLPPQDID